jgi:hypothetical protein
MFYQVDVRAFIGADSQFESNLALVLHLTSL